MPTIVFLSGSGTCGTDGLQPTFALRDTVMLAVEKWPFIIIFPQKQDPNEESLWEDEDAMVQETIKKTKAEFNVDASRLYLTGLSLGGNGTWTIAAKHPDLFAAIAPVCGWANEDVAKKVAKLPIWAFHGEKDDVVKLEEVEKMKKWIEAAGGTCKLTVYPGVGHNSLDNTYQNEDLGAWFLQHHK